MIFHDTFTVAREIRSLLGQEREKLPPPRRSSGAYHHGHGRLQTARPAKSHFAPHIIEIYVRPIAGLGQHFIHHYFGITAVRGYITSRTLRPLLVPVDFCQPAAAGSLRHRAQQNFSAMASLLAGRRIDVKNISPPMTLISPRRFDGLSFFSDAAAASRDCRLER